MIWLALFQLTVTAAVAAYLVTNLLHRKNVPVVSGPLDRHPSVTVCVPARNEARGVEACLRSLLVQEYPDFEVIAVDDNSTDGTGEILQRLSRENPCLTALTGEALPEGWLGKPFALHQAARRARGEYLLFTDADPVFHPRALHSAMYQIRTRGLDVLTLMPGAEFGSFWEEAVQPVIFALIAALSRFEKINSREHTKAMGVGAFLMFRREAYEAIGGHEAVRQEIVEDVAIAKLAKTRGCSLLLADGKQLLSIRMYHSLDEIRRGWKKNIFVALKRSILRTVYYMILIPLFTAGPYLTLLAVLLAGGSSLAVWAALAAWALTVGSAFALCDELRLSRRAAVYFPVGAFVVSSLLFDSMKGVLLDGKTEWRGRIFDTPDRSQGA